MTLKKGMKSAFTTACALIATAAYADHKISDFNTKLFWKRPDQGK